MFLRAADVCWCVRMGHGIRLSRNDKRKAKRLSDAAKNSNKTHNGGKSTFYHSGG